MKKIVSRYFLSALFLLLATAGTGYAQQIDSMINVYGERFPQEKIHVHFDKAVYNPGETIWFKTYLFSGFMPSGLSKNIYAEIIDAGTGRIIQRKTMLAFEASAAGSFDLPINYSASEVIFRAYTAWMTNFDSAFLYTKTIPVINGSSAAAKPAGDYKVTLRFFPEGGDLVAGLGNTIAFKAVAADGFPAKVKGALKDAKGNVVVNFKSVHDGMGRFELEPEAAGGYYAEWQDSTGASYKTELPAVKAQGATLQVLSVKDKKSFIIKRSADAGPELQKFYLLGHMYQQTVYKATVDLSANFMTSGLLPVNNLPSGILTVTLFDANWKPLAERIVFVNNNDYQFTPNVVTLGKNLAKRAQNVITIEVPDTLRTNLSVAVTDAGVSESGNENIMARILLTSDLRGYIHHPSWYFASGADSVQQCLDLVMLTNGWRRFKWSDLASGRFPLIKRPIENYLSLKGELLGLPASQIPPNTLLNIFLETKDSSRQMFMLPVNRQGKFGEEGMIFFDTVKLYYQFNQHQTLAGRAVVSFDNGTLRVPSLVTFNPAWRIYNPLDSLAANRSRYIAAESDRIRPELAKKIKTLETVTVTARQKSKKDEMDQKYASGLFSGGDGYSFNLLDDPLAAGARDIFTYLQGKVPGLQINGAGGPNGPTLTWRQSTPTLFLNEMQVDVSALSNMTVNDVAYVKVFRPPFFGAPGGGAGGAIAVYTKKGGDGQKNNNSPVPGGMEKNKLIGYASPKEFYSPDYSKDNALFDVPDVRTTLYWAPYVLTDKNNRKSTFIFYNNDVSRKLKIVLEGFNEEGRMTRVEKVLE